MTACKLFNWKKNTSFDRNLQQALLLIVETFGIYKHRFQTPATILMASGTNQASFENAAPYYLHMSFIELNHYN